MTELKTLKDLDLDEYPDHRTKEIIRKEAAKWRKVLKSEKTYLGFEEDNAIAFWIENFFNMGSDDKELLDKLRKSEKEIEKGNYVLLEDLK